MRAMQARCPLVPHTHNLYRGEGHASAGSERGLPYEW
jgi:hypothetical protein